MAESQYASQSQQQHTHIYCPVTYNCPGMFMSPTTGLGLLLEAQYQSEPSQGPRGPEHIADLWDTLPIYSTAYDLAAYSHIDRPDQWSEVSKLPPSSLGLAQSSWNVTHCQHTPLLSSPNFTTGVPQRHWQHEQTPALYSSPGASISTRCATPLSMISGNEDVKSSTSSLELSPLTPHDGYWGQSISPSMHHVVMGNTTYETHLALLASTSCSPSEQSVRQAPMKDHIKEEHDETQDTLIEGENPVGIKREEDDERRKLQVMKERTALKRQRLDPVPADGSKPQCPECFKSFSRKHNLRQHRLTSCRLLPSRTRDFACHDCAKTFHRQTDLQRHRASVCCTTEFFGHG